MDSDVIAGLVSEYAAKKGTHGARGFEKLIMEKVLQRLIVRSCGADNVNRHQEHVGARLQRLQEENLQLEIQLKELKQQLQLYK